MKTALILTTRAFSSDFKSLYEQMAFLREEYDEIHLVHPYSTDRLKKFIEETASIKIKTNTSISKDLDDIGRKHLYANWEEYYDAIDLSFLDGIHIDDVWMFGAPLSEGGHLRRGMNGLNKNFRKHAYMKFLSVAKLYMINYFALKIANEKGAFYHEMCYDPCEFSVEEITEEKVMPKHGHQAYHGYDIPSIKMKKHTAYQYGLKNVGMQFPFASKEYDAVFGYSYMTAERKSDHELMQSVYKQLENRDNCKLLYRSKPDGIDTLVEKDAYMALIADSRFTFILPAYMKNMFSCYRFIESLFHDCLPLIFDHCNYAEFFKSYGINSDMIQEIIVNETNLNAAISMKEERRIEILEYLKERLF
jgi:hypothetical protein